MIPLLGRMSRLQSVQNLDGADAAEFDGFGAGEDEVGILRLDGYEDGSLAHGVVWVPCWQRKECKTAGIFRETQALRASFQGFTILA
jgi:hypothetical protein